MNKKILMTFILTCASLNLLGQVNDDSIRQVVLKNSITDSLYVFGQWDESGGTESHLKYLGLIKTPKGNFKVMTSSWYWGLSKRATNLILVYDENNNHLGNYYVGMTYDLPEKKENNQLVFLHSKSDDCDKKTITRLSFVNGIPNEFFLECKDGFGDIYSFDKNKN